MGVDPACRTLHPLAFPSRRELGYLSHVWNSSLHKIFRVDQQAGDPEMSCNSSPKPACCLDSFWHRRARSAFFYSGLQLIQRGPPALGRPVVYFTASPPTYVLISPRKHLCRMPRIMFNQISGHSSSAKLTHKN